MAPRLPKKNKLAKKMLKQRQKMAFTAENSQSLSLYNSGKLQAAARANADALKANPANPSALYVAGLLHLRHGQLLLALDAFRGAVAAKPKFADAYFEMGKIHSRRGQTQAAIACFQKVVAINKNHLQAWNELGVMFYNLGDHKEIINCYKRSIEINGLDPNSYSNLAYALINTGELREAEHSCKKALALAKDYAPAYRNLGAISEKRGAVSDAVSFYRKSLALDPEHFTHSSILFALNYLPSASQEEIFAEAGQWDELYGSPLVKEAQHHAISPGEGRPLKIGYLSPDFRDHSVAYFIEPVLRCHHREKVTIHCYANVEKPDEVTQSLRLAADEWHDIWGLPDNGVADLIEKDGIDVLVDLAGHTKDNRLLVFARHPAPVQVTWLGYPNTTGMKTMDYRITDAIADPPGMADKLHSEKLIRLPHGFLCYQPDTSAPAVALPPCLKKGHITFGSFNNMAKVSAEVILLWASLLNAVANSRLILKSSFFANEESRDRYLKMFEAAGVGADRMEIFGRLPDKNDHLNLYGRIDIGLDPFPYNGTTTTCEALWMGVPVVTLRGNRHAGRVGASIMHHTGLDELVAESPEEYLALAVSLADDPAKLTGWRRSLRGKLQHSALMNSQQFTKELEEVYEEISLRRNFSENQHVGVTPTS